MNLFIRRDSDEGKEPGFRAYTLILSGTKGEIASWSTTQKDGDLPPACVHAAVDKMRSLSYDAWRTTGALLKVPTWWEVFDKLTLVLQDDKPGRGIEV